MYCETRNYVFARPGRRFPGYISYSSRNIELRTSFRYLSLHSANEP